MERFGVAAGPLRSKLDRREGGVRRRKRVRNRRGSGSRRERESLGREREGLCWERERMRWESPDCEGLWLRCCSGSSTTDSTNSNWRGFRNALRTDRLGLREGLNRRRAVRARDDRLADHEGAVPAQKHYRALRAV